MIVLGTFYVQTAAIDPAAVYAGIIVGILSATVLFVNSFPDYEADRSGGRRTLVVILGRRRASVAVPVFIAVAYVLIVAGIFVGYVRVYSLISVASLPFAVRSIYSLRKDPDHVERLVPAMSSTIAYSRLTGVLLALSFIV
jgi:1,4-dihydroxy-2-naphthoate octaprenyltransferase